MVLPLLWCADWGESKLRKAPGTTYQAQQTDCKYTQGCHFSEFEIADRANSLMVVSVHAIKLCAAGAV